jgi:glycerophosphoryl diester phosphodiesterase
VPSPGLDPGVYGFAKKRRTPKDVDGRIKSGQGKPVRADKLNLPRVIGHRGAAARAPENTLAGFRLAKSLGCAWVEFDVRLTADNALMVCHDDRVERTTDGRGAISQMPLAAIREFDAGSWFHRTFAGQRVPTLDETLELCRELDLGANIEIKAERGRGPATAAAVAATLGEHTGAPHAVLISSFLEDAVLETARHAPGVPRAMLWSTVPRDWTRIADALGCATINADQRYLSAGLVADIHAAGYPVLAYTVNDPARARQLFGWGVTSVFTDAPDIMLAAAALESGDGARQGARF